MGGSADHTVCTVRGAPGHVAHIQRALPFQPLTPPSAGAPEPSGLPSRGRGQQLLRPAMARRPPTQSSPPRPAPRRRGTARPDECPLHLCPPRSRRPRDQTWCRFRQHCRCQNRRPERGDPGTRPAATAAAADRVLCRPKSGKIGPTRPCTIGTSLFATRACSRQLFVEVTNTSVQPTLWRPASRGARAGRGHLL